MSTYCSYFGPYIYIYIFEKKGRDPAQRHIGHYGLFLQIDGGYPDWRLHNTDSLRCHPNPHPMMIQHS